MNNISLEAVDNMNTVLNRFFRRAPYGWLVLYNEPHLDMLDKTVDINQATSNCLEQFYLADKESALIESITTRRVVGEVVEFGLDYDNQLKLIIKLSSPHAPPRLDNFLFHGNFAETGRTHASEAGLYKLPYRWIHDAYDHVNNGEQNYYNVLRHILCDTLLRYRVKTVKVVQKKDNNTTKQSPFYFGFTEDGFHFAKTTRRVLSTEIYPEMFPDDKHDGYQVCHTFQTQRWLNLRLAARDERIHTIVKRGYIIYGRVIRRDAAQAAGKTTLEWCTPSPGIDLLRVFLATNGQSPIFKNLENADILNKMKDRDGNDTIASQLFLGLIDPEARNVAIDYVKNVLVWQ
jgi:hypothetical protein